MSALQIFHTLTADDLNDEPLAPFGEGWVIVRRVAGFTLWRSIALEPDPPLSGFMSLNAATDRNRKELK